MQLSFHACACEARVAWYPVATVLARPCRAGIPAGASALLRAGHMAPSRRRSKAQPACLRLVLASPVVAAYVWQFPESNALCQDHCVLDSYEAYVATESNMSCLAQQIRFRLRESSPESPRAPILSCKLRHCSTTSASASSTNASTRIPRWIPSSLYDAWQRVDGYRGHAKAPETVKQLAEAAGQGRLLRVIGIQSNNAWLRFGGIIVAVGCAGATYTVYTGAQNVYSYIVGVRDNSWALNAIVRCDSLTLYRSCES